MSLNIGSIKIPINAATKSFAILAKRGAGKTYLGGVMAEEFAKNSIPFVIFDPIDVWWGLRLKANGKDKGLPVVVFGIRHADIQIDRDMGRDIARAVVKDGISCVISTFGMPKVAARHLIAEFAEELMIINNTPRMVFIEEAHEYVPQRVMGGATKVFSAVEALVTMGRNQGIGVTMLNQRAATLNKDVLTQIDTLLALRSVGPQDRKALQDWVEGHGADGDFDKFLKSLPTLPTGEGWIWSPEFMGVFEKFKIRKRETFHPDREKIGSTFKMPELDQIDIQIFVSKFDAHIVESRKKQTKAEKKAEKKRKEEQVAGPDSFNPDTLVGAGFQGATYTHAAQEEAMRNLRNEYESKLMAADVRIRQLTGIINAAQRALGNPESVTGSSVPTFTIDVGLPSGETNLVLQKLGGMPKTMYEKLLQHPNGLTARQLALMCGYSISGSFRNARAKLKTMGLIKYEGEIIKALTR